MDYEKLLLDELRFITYEKTDAVLKDEALRKAVTLNENIQALGYVLAPYDVAELATSPSLEGLFDRLKGLTGTVDAMPMYPGFPTQVMEMDEAVFRFHQMVHYFSTYGIELLFGVQVNKGWLPHENETYPDIKEQDRILDARTIKLLPEEDMYSVPFSTILSRRERMTLPEQEILREAVLHLSTEQVKETKVMFKENLNALYEIIFAMSDRNGSFEMLRGLCQHTGDVFRCIEVLLKIRKYHFRTSEKRFLVKLLESYPETDLRTNLVLSGKDAERKIMLIDHLDYSVYSRSEVHMSAVNDLKDGRLRSWNSMVQALLEEKSDKALGFLSQRPGNMLRMIAWLLRLGYDAGKITESLGEKAESLSIQTLITNLNHFGKLSVEERTDCNALYEIFEQLIWKRMGYCALPFKGRKVCIRTEDYDLDVSEICTNDKSAEGGYIRSGIAYRIPAEVDKLRFFVYWDDRKDRVDIDLHAGYTDTSGIQHNIGWNEDFRNTGIVFSGDLTHNDSAEYIDIDLTAPIDRVNANIHLYCGKSGFDKVEKCLVGMMAVPEVSVDGRETSLYRAANCFFSHELRQACSTIHYGFIDVKNRCLIFDGAPDRWVTDWYKGVDHRLGKFSMRRYLELLLSAQDAVLCDSEDKADFVLVMGKPQKEKEISLIDSNFFMD